VIGGTLELLALDIPGVGPLIAAGPIMGALGGLGVEAATRASGWNSGTGDRSGYIW
jgi:hypothetical protein